MFVYTYFTHQGTVLEGISTVTLKTRARGTMIDDFTLGVGTTGAWARILAFGTYAAERGRAIRVNDTLGSTPFVGIANVIG